MAERLYLTNPAGLRAGHGGPGRSHLITAAPKPWLLALVDRVCLVGCPPSAAIMYAARRRDISWERYEEACRARWQTATREGWIQPGRLRGYRAAPWFEARQRLDPVLLRGGDTLLCVCAAGGICHRRWFADALQAAGWAVTLDGSEVSRD